MAQNKAVGGLSPPPTYDTRAQNSLAPHQLHEVPVTRDPPLTNFGDGVIISPIQAKSTPLARLLKKQAMRKCATPRQTASIAGALLDAVKSNAKLMGLPQQIARAGAAAIRTNAGRGITSLHAQWETPVQQSVTLKRNLL